jgi:hypothetical protein
VNRPLRLSIRRITVSAASGLEARRLADGLPIALEASLRRLLDGSAPPAGPPSTAERAAAEVTAALALQLEPIR